MKKIGIISFGTLVMLLLASTIGSSADSGILSLSNSVKNDFLAEEASNIELDKASPESDVMPPLITFEQDYWNHTLTVTDVRHYRIRWSDIDIEHEGSIIGISDDGDGFVDPGEMIFSLYGHTEIYYEPTGELIATFEFPPMLSSIFQILSRILLS